MEKAEKKKFLTKKVGTLQQLTDDGFKKVGNITVGTDAEDRLKCIVNLGDNVYSGFLNDPMTPEQKEKMALARMEIMSEK